MSDVIEIEALRDSFRGLLGDRCAPDQVLKHIDGHDLSAELWSVVSELGWIGLSVPEAAGGLGLGMAASAALYTELGRAVAPLPVLPVALVADALAYAGDEAQQSAWLAPLLTSKRRATLSAPIAFAAPKVSAVVEGEKLTLSGVADHLLDAKGATLLLVAARVGQGDVIRVIVDAEADGVTIDPVATTDGTRSLGRVRLDGLVLSADRILAGLESGAAIEARLARHAALAIACDAVGGSEAILASTVDYLKTREQFGRPIGSFQALKHRCADHKMAIVASAALLEEAVRLAEAGEAADVEIHAAKAYCCDVYAVVSRDAVQLHGGIGFTWEHPCHLYLKRAKLGEALFGSAAQHLDSLFTNPAA